MCHLAARRRRARGGAPGAPPLPWAGAGCSRVVAPLRSPAARVWGGARPAGGAGGGGGAHCSLGEVGAAHLGSSSRAPPRAPEDPRVLATNPPSRRLPARAAAPRAAPHRPRGALNAVAAAAAAAAATAAARVFCNRPFGGVLLLGLCRPGLEAVPGRGARRQGDPGPARILHDPGIPVPCHRPRAVGGGPPSAQPMALALRAKAPAI